MSNDYNLKFDFLLEEILADFPSYIEVKIHDANNDKYSVPELFDLLEDISAKYYTHDLTAIYGNICWGMYHYFHDLAKYTKGINKSDLRYPIIKRKVDILLQNIIDKKYDDYLSDLDLIQDYFDKNGNFSQLSESKVLELGSATHPDPECNQDARQWKRWPSKEAWERGDPPMIVGADGRVIE
jgi:hypothetical protein